MANNAVFVSQVVPTTVTAGGRLKGTMRMKNTGTTTWTRASAYRLGSQNPQDNSIWGTHRIELPSSVSPGATANIPFDVKAPTAPGSYNFRWKMVRDGVEWFGPLTTNVVVKVGAGVQPPGPGIDGAAFVSQSVPGAIARGAKATVSVTMRNSGSTAWTRAGLYRLGSQNPQDNAIWGLQRVELGATESVPPGGTKVFTFQITATALTPGANFQWMMVRDGVRWFGAMTPNVAVVILGPDQHSAPLCPTRESVANDLHFRMGVDVTKAFLLITITNYQQACKCGWSQIHAMVKAGGAGARIVEWYPSWLQKNASNAFFKVQLEATKPTDPFALGGPVHFGSQDAEGYGAFPALARLLELGVSHAAAEEGIRGLVARGPDDSRIWNPNNIIAGTPSIVSLNNFLVSIGAPVIEPGTGSFDDEKVTNPVLILKILAIRHPLVESVLTTGEISELLWLHKIDGLTWEQLRDLDGNTLNYYSGLADAFPRGVENLFGRAADVSFSLARDLVRELYLQAQIYPGNLAGMGLDAIDLELVSRNIWSALVPKAGSADWNEPVESPVVVAALATRFSGVSFSVQEAVEILDSLEVPLPLTFAQIQLQVDPNNLESAVFGARELRRRMYLVGEAMLRDSDPGGEVSAEFYDQFRFFTNVRFTGNATLVAKWLAIHKNEARLRAEYEAIVDMLKRLRARLATLRVRA